MPIARRSSLLLAPVFLLGSAHAQSLDAIVQKETPDLTAIYKDLHEHPELSHHEERTSAIVAKAFREAGYTVTDHVGVYPDGSRAFGVVGCWCVAIWMRCPSSKRRVCRMRRM
jgi:hypothetical protein